MPDVSLRSLESVVAQADLSDQWRQDAIRRWRRGQKAEAVIAMKEARDRLTRLITMMCDPRYHQTEDTPCGMA